MWIRAGEFGFCRYVTIALVTFGALEVGNVFKYVLRIIQSISTVIRGLINNGGTDRSVFITSGKMGVVGLDTLLAMLKAM
jgi:hypothetical protein